MVVNGDGTAEPAPDIQAALTALGHRPHCPERQPIDLTGLHLIGAQLAGANLTGANLTGTTVSGSPRPCRANCVLRRDLDHPAPGRKTSRLSHRMHQPHHEPGPGGKDRRMAHSITANPCAATEPHSRGYIEPLEMPGRFSTSASGSRVQSEYSFCTAATGRALCPRRIVSAPTSEAKVGDLALLDQLLYRCGDVFDGHVGVDTALIEHIDPLGLEPT